MRRPQSIWRVVAVFLLVLIPFGLIVLWISDSSSGRVLLRSDEPPALDYHSRDPYVLLVTEGPVKWRTFGWPTSKEVTIFSKASGGDYVYEIDIDVAGSNPERVNWSKEGVLLTFAAGHTLFVPKDAFVGGR